MGILDIFKKKKTEPEFPVNELEKCLMQATSSVSARKDFYQKLLWNQLYVLTGGVSDAEQGNRILEADTTVQLVVFETGHIPVFTSTNRIFDNGIVKKEVNYLSLKGQDLFDLAKGATFMLNPYSDYRKELIPEEIASLMDGTIYDQIDDSEIATQKNEQFNKIFRNAGEKQKGLIYLDGYNRKALSKSEKLRLEESIDGFKECLGMIPDHWQAWF
ncbi:SseB family protein [Flavihumibacter petaseus]|uniref:SseB protein N-terminal domain-containing protein n=1 Tax=Flavihumibacter petaseus NBRC 106054 TaxID=1220578 RepID=A0A0E9MXA2_9BACT|nr:SseB family protein [Flavihumibacter petaseus]GAO41750.1 hypothetical protein FPE01S_01_07640 [Flavihumibacter petaseus NBRC 106054]